MSELTFAERVLAQIADIQTELEAVKDAEKKAAIDAEIEAEAKAYTAKIAEQNKQYEVRRAEQKKSYEAKVAEEVAKPIHSLKLSLREAEELVTALVYSNFNSTEEAFGIRRYKHEDRVHPAIILSPAPRLTTHQHYCVTVPKPDMKKDELIPWVKSFSVDRPVFYL